MHLESSKAHRVTLRYSSRKHTHAQRILFVPETEDDCIAMQDQLSLLAYIDEHQHLAVHEAAIEWAKLRAQEGP